MFVCCWFCMMVCMISVTCQGSNSISSLLVYVGVMTSVLAHCNDSYKKNPSNSGSDDALCSRQPLQEQLVERLLAAAAARHTQQQRVSEQRGPIRAAARAVLPAVGALPQVERQQHLLLLLLLLLHAQLVSTHTEDTCERNQRCSLGEPSNRHRERGSYTKMSSRSRMQLRDSSAL